MKLETNVNITVRIINYDPGMPAIRNKTLFGCTNEIWTSPCYSPNQRYFSQYAPQEFVLQKYKKDKVHTGTGHEIPEYKCSYMVTLVPTFLIRRCAFQQTTTILGCLTI